VVYLMGHSVTSLLRLIMVVNHHNGSSKEVFTGGPPEF